MRLYYSKGACSLAVRIIIHELNIPCEFTAVNLKTKQTEDGHDFYKINSKGAVPALELNDKKILTENSIIQQYLADYYQAKQLLPAVGDINRYRVLELLNFVSADVHKSFGPFFNEKVPDALKEEVFKPLLKNKLNYVEQVLKEKDFLFDNHFTLPDAYLFVVSRWLPAAKLDIKAWPNLHRYFNQLKNRESIQKSLQEEGL